MPLKKEGCVKFCTYKYDIEIVFQGDRSSFLDILCRNMTYNLDYFRLEMLIIVIKGIPSLAYRWLPFFIAFKITGMKTAKNK